MGVFAPPRPTADSVEIAPVRGEPAHVPALDGLRGLAILGVMLAHETALGRDTFAERFGGEMVRVGASGVDLFFVLSGFLITGILLDSRERAHYYRNFYARRVLRIFPLYYAVVFAALVVLPHLHVARFDRWRDTQGIWYWTYLSNFYIARRKAFVHGILDVSWSLSIEEQFYLVWPWAVASLGRRGLRSLCLALLAAALFLRVALAIAGVHPIAIHVLTFTRVDTLAAGALLAIEARERGGLGRYARAARPLAAFAFAAVTLTVALQSLGVPTIAFASTAGYSVTIALYAALLTLAVAAPAGDGWRGFVSAAPLRALGRISYALYLFHSPIQSALHDTAIGVPGLQRIVGNVYVAQLVFYVLATLAALPPAIASFYFFERPILSLKRFFPTNVVKAEPREAIALAPQGDVAS
jgi:peptidoglycan/LPS O-acetylase OafA/YrhL